MNIVVCMKQVPDTDARKDLQPDFTLDREHVDKVINPFDEYAIEAALRLKDSQGGEVTVVSMGPPSAEESIRRALAMGADKGVLITDPALHGTDWYGTVQVLSRAISRQQFDLVITGMESTDARTGLVPGGLAEVLELPLLSYAAQIDVQNGTVSVQREVTGGFQEATAPAPAVISVVKGANEPRYPSLKGIMAAKRKPVDTLSLNDLDIAPDQVGLTGAKTVVTVATPRPEKQPGEVVHPGSAEEAAAAIADFLQANKFI